MLEDLFFIHAFQYMFKLHTLNFIAVLHLIVTARLSTNLTKAYFRLQVIEHPYNKGLNVIKCYMLITLYLFIESHICGVIAANYRLLDLPNLQPLVDLHFLVKSMFRKLYQL